MNTLTQERLKELIHYNSESGLFSRLKPVQGMRNHTGSIRPDGYLAIGVDGHQYLAHRLVWLWLHGHFPPDQVDHIDGDKSNNKIINLRLATSKQNRENQQLQIRNKTGARGVLLDKRTGRFVAKLRHHGEDIHVGVFDTVEQASIAVKNVRDQLFTHHKTPFSA